MWAGAALLALAAVLALPVGGAAPVHPTASTPAASATSSVVGPSLRGLAASVELSGGPFVPARVGAAPPVLSPRRSAVNPFSYYTKEPAPMGLSDFGVNGSGAAYNYSTTRFVGTVTARALTVSSVENLTAFQLNAVAVLVNGSRSADYWVQDVIYLQGGTGLFFALDNVWNFTTGSAYVTPGSVEGSGSIEGAGVSTYYSDVPGTGWSGNDVTLGFPATVSAELVAGDDAGRPYVEVLYDDGYGWQGYDNLTFPWNDGWTFRDFEVNGSAYDALGTFYDAEWVQAGPGDQRNVGITAENLTLSLEYDNGHNMAPVLNAYDFGGDSAETASSVVSSCPSSSATGEPVAHLTGGSGAPARLYNDSDTAALNASPPLLDGTLEVNQTAVDYSGGNVNVTLLPGSYRLTLLNGSSTVAERTENLSAGSYLGLSFANLSSAPAGGLPGATVGVEGSGYLPGSTVLLAFGNGPTLGNVSVAANGTIATSFSVPEIANGTYRLTGTDAAIRGDSASLPFEVRTTLGVLAGLIAPDRPELGRTTEFEAWASEGVPPYATYSWQFGDGGNASGSAASVGHEFTATGTYEVGVTVRDAIGDLASTNFSVVVVAGPHLTTIEADRPGADVGQSVRFSTNLTGGAPPYTFTWSGLPTGCTPEGSTAACASLPVAGSFTIDVSVNDSEGVRSTAAPAHFVVAPALSLPGIVDGTPYVDVGSPISLLAPATGGLGPVEIDWSGLPSGCAPSGPSVGCAVASAGSWNVSAVATDANGAATAPVDLTVNVATDPAAVLARVGATAGTDAGQSLTLRLEVTGGSGGFAYSWSGLPGVCDTSSPGNATCRTTASGNRLVTATAVDAAGRSARASLNLTIDPPVRVRWQSLPGGLDTGSPITLAAAASGGSGPYAFAWSGLPPGCVPPDGSTLACRASVPGGFAVGVTATDSNGESVTATTDLLIAAPPTLIGPAAGEVGSLAGALLTLSVAIVGGSGGYTISWSGLPAGCASVDTTALACRPGGPGNYPVTVTVNDSAGGSARTTFMVRIGPSLIGLPFADGAALLVGTGAPALLLALVVVRRRRRPGAPTSLDVLPDVRLWSDRDRPRLP